MEHFEKESKALGYVFLGDYNEFKKIRSKFQYPLDMEAKIIEHEEKTLKLYSNIIMEKYKSFFEDYGCEVSIRMGWQRMKKFSEENRLPLKDGYLCVICCCVHKKGEQEILELPFYEEGGDMRSLMATWIITWIGSPLCKKPYELFSNVEEIYEEMDGMVELLRDASAMQKY